MNELIKKELGLSHKEFTKEQIELIKNTIAKGATDDELKLFVCIAQSKGLDPFSRQIYFQKRKSYNSETRQYEYKASIETSIDGFRILSERTGKYAGYKGPLWCGKDGKWVDVWLEDKPPVAAKVGVMRTDFSEPVWAIAKFASYASYKQDGSLTHIWAKMPELMIAKVAEALARRIAFPDQLSGLYTKEEMDQTNNPDMAETKKHQSKPKEQIIEASWDNLVPAKPTIDEQFNGDDLPDFSVNEENLLRLPHYAVKFSTALEFFNGQNIIEIIEGGQYDKLVNELNTLQESAKKDTSKAEIELILMKVRRCFNSMQKEAA